jgi:hypothetical protein
MKIITAIASTTHIDLHNERMAKSALDSMALQIRSKYIPQLIDHDFNRQIGILLYGKVAPMVDGEFALYVVSGVFEDELEKQSYISGSPNMVWQKYEHYLDDIEKLEKQTLVSKKTNPSKAIHKGQPNIADLLETHLDSTQVLPDGTVYKIKKFIAATGDLRIEVYPKDHYPAHFHVVSKQRGINARFDLNTLDFLSIKNGKIKENDIKKIQSFFKFYPDILDKLRKQHKRMN